MKIYNLTQHAATAEQIEAGVVDLPEAAREELQKLLTFDELPDCRELRARARKVGSFVAQMLVNPDEFAGGDFYADEETVREAEELTHGNAPKFLIGGAPFFMAPLAEELHYFGDPLFAFSKRESVEEVADGKVIKRSVFKHAGFVPAC